MFFVTLSRFRGKPSKDFLELADKAMKNPPPGVKIHNVFWTLGRYDVIIIYEAPNEKVTLKMGMPFSEYMASETLTAIPREEALELIKSP